VAILSLFAISGLADADVYLTGVPDYDWQYGCFGTAGGNLMGYWDRHGFPNFYNGPTAGGRAPLNNYGTNAGIRSMWASQSGFDGRPAGQYGHTDDYYSSYASTATDRYVLASRVEHASGCIGDFIGLSQKRWTNMNNECDGNIDGYAFVFWETNGTRRLNHTPPAQGTNAGKDLPSGLRAWARSRGCEADTFSQLAALNPKCPEGEGFTFADVKAEIDAGFPVLAFLQNPAANSRSLSGMPKANPLIHGVLIFGYQTYDGYGTNVYVRDSWGGGLQTRNWSGASWVGGSSLPVRGFIGFHPKPCIRSLTVSGAELNITWDGPSSELYDDITGTTTMTHFYQVEAAPTTDAAEFQPVGPVTSERALTIPLTDETAFYRVRLLP
jgi:hypothetical protein